MPLESPAAANPEPAAAPAAQSAVADITQSGGHASAPLTQSAGASAAGAPAAGSGSSGAAVSPAPMESLRDTLARMGATDLTTQFQDDGAILQHLLLQRQQAAQAQELARYGQQVIGQWPKVQEFLAQQQSQQQKQAGDPWFKEWWNPPEFNPAWEKMILKDAQGNLHPAPGAPPDVVQKYAQYRQFREQQVDKLISNPFEFLAPAIKSLARQEAEAIAKQNLAQHTDQQFAQDFITKNADWLYQRDQAGQPVVDQLSRQPVLTEWGVRFRDHVVRAQQQGITDIRAMQDWALKATQLDYLLANSAAGGVAASTSGGNATSAGVSQTPTQAAGAAAKQTFLQQAAGANRLPNVGPQANNGQSPANQAGLSLAERLRAKFKAAGVNDSDLS